MKCASCNTSIETTFLGKIKGTFKKDDKGKQIALCSKCQSAQEKKSQTESNNSTEQ